MTNRSTEHDDRIRLINLHQQGHSYHDIAGETQLNYYTVRKWVRAFKNHGWPGIDPHHTNCPTHGALSRFDPMVKYVALKLKRRNPGWGLAPLLLAMRRQPSLAGLALPSRTALYMYLRPFLPRLCVKRRGRTIRPKPDSERTTAVHQRWQMDFKGEVKIPLSGTVLPFNVCDEHSSAPLAGIIYATQGNHPKKGLTTRDVQQALRHIFTRWGRPYQLRMDRDTLWVGSSRLEWPGVLLLWLVGLDIVPVINRPGRPTDNAQVERLNRTWLEHVGFSLTTASVTQVQAATDQAWHDRLFHLPSHNRYCQGQTPAHTFPELFASSRPYHSDAEKTLFDITRVHRFLAQWQWPRKVDKTGCISLNDTNRLVSKAHCKQIVNVRFDADTAQFIATTVDGIELKRFTLPSIDSAYIRGTGSPM